MFCFRKNEKDIEFLKKSKDFKKLDKFLLLFILIFTNKFIHNILPINNKKPIKKKPKLLKK
jgi:hypothetical protein